MKRLAVLAFASLATLTGLYAAWELRGALVVFALSIVLASSVEPVIESLVARRLDRRLAIALAYVLGITSVVVLVWLVSGSIVDEAQRGLDEVARVAEDVQREWPEGNAAQRLIAHRLPATTVASVLHGVRATDLVPGALGATKEVVSIVAESIIILFLGLYWSASTESMERLWLSIVPAGHRPTARSLWDALKEGVGDQVRRKLGQTILAVLLLQLGFSALGLSYLTMPAVVAGVARVIPVVGIPVGVLAAMVFGLATSPLAAVVAGGYALAVLVFLRKVLGPRFFRAREFSPFLLVVVVILLAEPLGLIGLLIAPPVAAAIQIVFEQLFVERAQGAPRSTDIEDRVRAVRRRVEEQDAPPHLRSLVLRLDSLVEEVKEAARAA